jgi:Domain of unknown function (DUF4249)
MNKTLLISCLLFSVISCTKEIEIKIPEKQPKLVVSSTLVPFTLPMPAQLGLELQSSLNIFDTTKKALIKDALVLYYENNLLIDTIKYVDILKKYLISTSINKYPVAGNNYSIQIIKQGFATVTAETSIPQIVNITKLDILPIAYLDETGAPYSEVSIAFTDPGDKINFYEIEISDITQKFTYELSSHNPIITGESYYPSVLDFKNNMPTSLLFNDSKINGQKLALKIYYPAPLFIMEHSYISDHTISVHLRNVTEEYYKNKTSFIRHSYSLQENILYGSGEPINVYSNTHNGYGIFAGYNTSIQSLHIPQTLVK